MKEGQKEKKEMAKKNSLNDIRKIYDLKDKVAIVTGAGRGMGRTHALTLSQAGADVVVSDVLEDGIKKVAEEIKKIGGKALAIKCDVANKKEVDELIAKTIEKFGKIDILVNNAGICPFKPFLEMTEEEFERVIRVNLKGYFLCAQAAAREMAKQKSGVIINIASIAMGQVGMGFSTLTHYCASKGGIVAMAEAMAIELAPLGIRVNTISPGAIETPMVDPLKKDPQAFEGLIKKIPLQRIGKPEEISNVVLFLASPASSYMTGSVIIVDGGWTSTS